MLKWLLISTDWSLPFPGTTSERQSHSTHDKQLELTCFLRGGGNGGGFALLGSPQCGCCSSVQGLQLTSHSCWGLMTEHCKSQQRGHFLNSAGFALIGSGTAILTAYLIASWEKLPLKCESKHVDCRRKSWLSDTPDEKAYFFMFYILYCPVRLKNVWLWVWLSM